VLDKILFTLKNKKYPTRENRFKTSLSYPDLVMAEVDLLYIQKSNFTGSIFVHLPKCGGTSVKSALSLDLYGHPFLADMLLNGLNKGVNVCTVSRNPYARLVSSYEYLKKGGEYNRTFKSLVLDRFDSFEDFIINWLDEESIHTWIHLVPQVEFLKVDNKVVVDCYIKLENIDDEWSAIKKYFSSAEKLEVKNSSSTSERDWADYYNDDLKSKVYSLYKADFEYFGYEK
jgi:hypothetical protein